jgi:hypothetical protein
MESEKIVGRHDKIHDEGSLLASTSISLPALPVSSLSDGLAMQRLQIECTSLLKRYTIRNVQRSRALKGFRFRSRKILGSLSFPQRLMRS